MDKLKPCPFCGGEAELFKDQHDTLKIGYDYFVWCCDVECNGGTDEYTKSDLAIKKWNTRTPDKESVNNAQRYKEENTKLQLEMLTLETKYKGLYTARQNIERYKEALERVKFLINSHDEGDTSEKYILDAIVNEVNDSLKED